MDLNSSLFNIFEEPENMDRRNFLKAGVAAGTVSLTSVNKLLETPKASEEKLDQIYEGGFPGFDEHRPNMLVDVIEIGENYLQDEVIETIESIYDENGVNAIFGRRKDRYSEEDFQSHYGGDVARILGTDGYTGFIQDQVSSTMRNSAVQMVMSPGKVDRPKGWLEYGSGQNQIHRTGFATDSIALGSDTAFREGYSEDFLRGKTLVLLHELGHAQGLEHSDDPSNVMYKHVDLDADLGYSSGQWRKIKWRRIKNLV